MKRFLGFLVIVGGALFAVFLTLLVASSLKDINEKGLAVYFFPAFVFLMLLAGSWPAILNWFNYRKAQEEIENMGGLSHFINPFESHIARRRRRPFSERNLFSGGKKFTFEKPFLEIATELKKTLSFPGGPASGWKIDAGKSEVFLTGPFWSLKFSITSGRYNLLTVEMTLTIAHETFGQETLSWWLWRKEVIFPTVFVVANRRGLSKVIDLIGETYKEHLSAYLFHEKNAGAAFAAAKKELEVLEKDVENFLGQEMKQGKTPSPDKPIQIPEELAPIFQWTTTTIMLFEDIAKTR